MKLAIISEGFHMWSLYVAHAKRFFERAGLAVDITLTGASGPQLEALGRGEFDIGLQQSDHIVRAVEHGSDLFIFMANAHQPVLNLVVARGIAGFDGLRGKVLAVDGARSGYALLQTRLLAERGLSARDYTVIEAGGVKARYEALRTNAAVAAWLNPPYDEWLFAEGYGSLGQVSDFFPGYPGSVAATRRSWARQNEAVLVAFIRAHNAAYAWLIDEHNRKEAEEIAVARLKVDPGQAAAAYRVVRDRPQPQITPDGLRQVIDIVWESEGFKQAKGEPGKYMDLSYLSKA